MSHGKKSKRKKHQKHTELKHTEADKYLNRKSPHVEVTGRVETNFPPDLVKRYDTANQNEEGWNRKVFAAEIVAAILLGASVTAVAWQGFLLRESNRINRDALQSVQRAFISFQKIDEKRLKIKVPTGKSNQHFWQVTPIFENSGVTPAISVIVYAGMDKFHREPDEDTFRGNAGSYNIISIGPKTTQSLAPLSRPETFIFGKEFEEITEPNVVGSVFIWAWVGYRDIFHAAHVTEFCGRMKGAYWSDDFKNILWDVEVCSHHNCIDESCGDFQSIKTLLPDN